MSARSMPPRPHLALRRRDLLRTGVALGTLAFARHASAAVEPLDLCALRGRLEHHNTDVSAPRAIYEPRTRGEVIDVVSAAAANRQLRPMGDGWNFSNLTHGHDWLIRTRGLDSICDVDRSTLAPGVDPTQLVTIGAGTTFQQLNAWLWRRDRAVLNMPGFQQLTVVGCAAAGGHGSGLFSSGISDHLEAVDLVTVGQTRQVRLVRVERTRGLSSPTEFSKQHPTVELIQDDTLLRAVRCGLGCLGIITSVTVRTQPAFFLVEDRWSAPWTEARHVLAELAHDPEIHSLHAWLNPYAGHGHEHQCAITTYRRTTLPVGGERAFGIRAGGLNGLTETIRAALWLNPDSIPEALDFGLRQVLARDVVRPCHEALDFGPPNTLPVHAASCGVAADTIEAVVDDLFERFPVWARRNQWVSSPIGLRWVRSSEDWLSPQRGRDTVMIEVPILKGTPNATQTLDRYVRHLLENFHARPHWGQQNPMGPAHLLAAYGEEAVGAFADAMNELDPHGVFDGVFTRQVGLREVANAR